MRLGLSTHPLARSTSMSYYNHSTTYTSFATDAEALAWAYASSQNQSYAPSSSVNTSSTQQAGSSNQTHIQIVLEPAESCNDSGEGSGQDDSDGGRKRYVSRLRPVLRPSTCSIQPLTCTRISGLVNAVRRLKSNANTQPVSRPAIAVQKWA